MTRGGGSDKSRWKSRRLGFAAAAAGLVLAGLGAPAWSDEDASVTVQVDPAAFSASEPSTWRPSSPSSDDRISEGLAKAGVDWFAGLYRDGGSTVVLTTRPDVTPREMSTAVQALADAEILSTRDTFPSVQVEPATYAFGELDAWKRSLQDDFFAQSGAVLTDLDERANRIVLGFDATTLLQEAVHALVERSIVPPEAVEIRPQAPIVPLGLDDRSAAPIGGLQIQNLDHDDSICSLGFAARRNGVRGIVTAAHCTSSIGEVDGDRFFQPLSDEWEWLLGRETVDPPLFTGGDCPAGKRCRYSDAAFIETEPGLPDAQGLVASMNRLNDPDAWSGDTDAIIAVGAPILGTLVYKVGSTTGKTQGTIDRACVDFVGGEPGENIIFACQSRATFHSAGGDSGAPVLGYIDSAGFVSLYGILHGEGGYFSPLGNIIEELGALDYVAGR